ncbi:polysaccharide pyruvyl transferase family protein [Peribacillus sp. NPDC101480]|uniref:polysaccharide pyruvyl transferase family protein n=1 Tax=Peribacillus sp. NPDC101480 TaxID=3390620 RepID=UPI003CFBF980
MIKVIKKVASSNKYIYQFLSKSYHFYKLRQVVKESLIDRNNKSIFLLLEQEHGNLGDIALGYARKKFLQDHFPEYNLIGITEREYNNYTKYIKKIVKSTDIITLIGGGSLGDQYLEHENSRRSIIENFRNNKIISFPQSMYFSNTIKGKQEQEISKGIYSSNKNLTLVARDKVSYKLMKNTFENNKVILTPDIVLYLNETIPKRNREGALALIRSDVEGVLSSDEKEKIFALLKVNYKSVNKSDTLINRDVPRQKVSEELSDLFEMIKKAELIITDRLHGMVFAAITSTPCIVLSNYNHKIKSQYEWIMNLNYIKFLDDINDIEHAIDNLKNADGIDYNNEYVKSHYQQIINEVVSS